MSDRDPYDLLSSGNNVLDVLRDVRKTQGRIYRRNVKAESSSDLVDNHDMETRAIDDNGLLRMIMSATNLFNEIGVSAHFAGLAADGVTPTLWIDADNGKLTAGTGVIFLDENGISVSANNDQYDIRAYKFLDDVGDRIGGVYGYFVDGAYQVTALRTFAKTGRYGYADLVGEGAARGEARMLANGSLTGTAYLRLIQTSTNGWVQMDGVEYIALQEFSADPAYLDNYALLYYLDTGVFKIRHKQGATETEIVLGATSGAMDYDQLHAEIG